MRLVNKNIRYLRKLRSWTQEQFALKLNIKRSLLGAYEEDRAEPKLEVLEAICNIFKLSLDDLLLKNLSEQTEPFSYISKRRILKLEKEAPNVIHFVPIKASAGYLAGYADREFLEELNTFTLPMLAPGFYRAFEIVGDSMLPTPSGSVVVGEKVESLQDIKNQNPYIVVSKSNGVVYKRLSINNKSKDKITLISDNPLYEPYQLASEDVLELWKAQMIITKPEAQNRWDVNQLAGMVTSLQEQVSSLKKKIH